MDRDDEQSGRMDQIYQQLHSAYCQFPITGHEFCGPAEPHQHENVKDSEDVKPGLI